MEAGAGLRQHQDLPDPDRIGDPDGDPALRLRAATAWTLAALGLSASAAALISISTAGGAAASNAACAQPGAACVVVRVVGADGQVGPLHFIAASDVSGDSADVQNQSYDVPNSPGVSVVRGSSVRLLLSDAGVDPSTVHFAEVQSDDSSTDPYGRHLLTAAELGPGGFPSGQPPVVYVDGNNDNVLSYVRPQRNSNDDQKAQGPDQGLLLSGNDGSIEITAHLTGQPLSVTATASPTDGTNRSFALASQPTGSGYTFGWVFPDGTTNAEPSPTYTFPSGTQGGSYPISVGVEQSSDGSFGWGTVNVQLGPAPSPSPNPSHSGSGGHGGGHHGPSDGPSTSPTTGPHPRPSPSGSGGSASPSMPASPSATVPASPSPSATQAPSTTPSASVRPTPAASSSGPEVTGVLLASGINGSGGSVDLGGPRPSQAAAPVSRTGLHIDPLVWAALVGVGLLGAGATSESDRARRWLRGRWSKMGP